MRGRVGSGAVAAAWLAAAALLVGCGGDDAPASVTEKAEGAYVGTLATAPAQVLVLENDEFWLFYGNADVEAGQPFEVIGFVQGPASSGSGSLRSINALDYGAEPVNPVELALTYVPDVSMNGNISPLVGNDAVGVSAGPFAAAVYNYDAAASLADIEGDWTLDELGFGKVTIDVPANGVFSGSGGGCIFSGLIVPRPSKKNVFDVTINYQGEPCRAVNQSMQGVGMLQTVGGSQQLIIGAVTSFRGDASGTDAVQRVALFGTR
jgi:hypothetical protein